MCITAGFIVEFSMQQCLSYGWSLFGSGEICVERLGLLNVYATDFNLATSDRFNQCVNPVIPVVQNCITITTLKQA